jgi:glycosyltransferase involved in cell wall biosynthesis
MSILFLDPVGTLGGAERSLLDLVAAIQAMEARIPIGLIVGGEGPLAQEARDLGVRVSVLPLPRRLSRTGEHAIMGIAGIVRNTPSLASAGASLGSYARELDRAVCGFAPTVIHSNGMKMHLLSAILPRRGVRVVWHLRDFLGQRAVMRRVLRTLASRADGLVAISRAIAEDAEVAVGRRDVTVIYNGIDTQRFTPEGPRVDLDALSQLPPLPRGVVRVGLVATYARWKGQDVFIDAAARFVALHGTDRARFYVVGGPQYDTDASQFSEHELRARIDARKLRAIVGVVPFQTAPELVYRSLDVAVHASTRPEPFGRTIAEAMASGCALISAREGGAAELGTAQVDAAPITPRDASLLAAEIAALVSDPARRAHLGAAARATALRRFSRERLGPEILGVYRRIGAIASAR